MGILGRCRLLVVVFLAHSLLHEYVAGLRPMQLPSERNPFEDEKIVLNNRPLIGILSQPTSGSSSSYIAASYVKFVEAGGARAVPLLYDEPEDILKQKFAAINGILFPGGGASLLDGPFYRAAEKLFNWALEANDDGDYFPIYGVCLGFELLSILLTKDHNILEPFKAHMMPAPFLFVNEAAKEKSFFKWFSDDLVEKVTTQNLTLENHEWGLSPSKFAAVKPLSDFFEVLTVTADEDNQMYVSTVQSWNYPVTAIQYHPEKNIFEWGSDSVPHSSAATQLTQGMAGFVISEARKSKHLPASKAQEDEFLIYNTNPLYTGKNGNGFFDQTYLFSLEARNTMVM